MANSKTKTIVNDDGSITKAVANKEGQIVKEIRIPPKNIEVIAQPKQQKYVRDTELSDEFNNIPEHRKIQNQENSEKRREEVASKHKIRTSTGREIEKHAPGESQTDWAGDLAEILADPDALNNLTEHFDNIVRDDQPWFKEMWEKQKETMGEMDEIIEEETEFLNSALSDGSVVNGLYVVKSYAEKLSVLLDAVEKFLDMEISSSPNYSEAKAPYVKAHQHIEAVGTEISNLIDNVLQEKKRLVGAE